MQALAILELVQKLGRDEAFSAVADPIEAEQHALVAIESGDTELLAALITASEQLSERPITRHLVLAIFHTEHNNTEQAHESARFIAENAKPMQSRGHATRLRNCKAARPDLTGLDDIIAIIAIIEPTGQQ